MYTAQFPNGDAFPFDANRHCDLTEFKRHIAAVSGYKGSDLVFADAYTDAEIYHPTTERILAAGTEVQVMCDTERGTLLRRLVDDDGTGASFFVDAVLGIPGTTTNDVMLLRNRAKLSGDQHDRLRTMLNDRELMYAAAEHLWDGEHLANVFAEMPTAYRDDSGFMEMLVSKHGALLGCASERLRHDRSFLWTVLDGNGMLLEFVPESLRDDERVVRDAVCSAGKNLMFNDDFTAALQFASDRIRANKVWLLDVSTNYFHNRPSRLLVASLLIHTADSVRGDREFVLSALTSTPCSTTRAPESAPTVTSRCAARARGVPVGL